MSAMQDLAKGIEDNDEVAGCLKELQTYVQQAHDITKRYEALATRIRADKIKARHGPPPPN